MSITALPTPPIRTDPTTFSARTDAFLAALPTFATEANALATTVNGYATSTAADKIQTAADVVAAAASAANAAAAAGAAKWISGTSYAEGVCVWSPVNQQTYRRKSAGAGSTDPSSDSANWSAISGSSLKAQLSMTTISSITYNADGSVNVITYSSGNKETMTYSSGILATTLYYDTNGSTLLYTETYTYTNGALTAVTWS